MRNRLASPVLAAAALAIGAGPAGAHGGDTALVHSCIGGGGNVTIVAADESCKKNEVALDWSRDAGAGTTYTAGAGLTLSPGNVFNVTGAPWSGLTGMPAGFEDGIDDEGPALTWGNLTEIPSDLLNGDDDGSGAVSAFATQLATDDGAPNQAGDPVSFSKIKDLTSASGGRITGEYIRNETIASEHIVDGTITARDLAGSDAPEAIVAGAVTSEKILDRTIQARDLAPGVLDRIVTTMMPVGSQEILPGQRVAVAVPLAGVDRGDMVVVSPPASLDGGLVFAGSDVLALGTVTIYLHNITAAPIELGNQTWTIRHLRTDD